MAEDSKSQIKPMILIHGGAGTVPDNYKQLAKEGAHIAVQAGWEKLATKGSALDAVEAAVMAMEEYPTFNAGLGSVLTEDSTIEMDALIMDGKERSIGGVIAVSKIAHPIALSRIVLHESPHVLFAGEGAEKFALEHGMELIDPESLITDRVRERLVKFLKEKGDYGSYIEASQDPEKRDKFGTVGAVAIDADGNLAAATSTGGVLGKKVGRVGDTPIVGAGTYADDEIAFSGTGIGEFIIRQMLGYDIKARLRDYDSVRLAAAASLQDMKKRLGGHAGLIALTRTKGWTAITTTKDLIWAAFGEGWPEIKDFMND